MAVAALLSGRLSPAECTTDEGGCCAAAAAQELGVDVVAQVARRLGRGREPLVFSRATTAGVELLNGGEIARCRASPPGCTAMCASLPMSGGGVHTATFQVLRCKGCWAVGLVRLGGGGDGRQPLERTDGYASETSGGWMWCAQTGVLKHDSRRITWAGMEGFGPADSVSLVLDLGSATLTAFKNGARLGEIVASDLHSGSFCWAAQLFWEGEQVCISACPTVTVPALSRVGSGTAG